MTVEQWMTGLQAFSAVLLAVVVYMLKGILDQFRVLQNTVSGKDGHGEQLAAIRATLDRMPLPRRGYVSGIEE